MKRLIIAIALLVLIISASTSSLIHLYISKNQLTEALGQINDCVDAKKIDQAQSLTEEFHRMWHESEQVIIRYVRHNELDDITASVAMLQSLLQYENIAEFRAQTDRIEEMITRVYEAEVPTLKNIF